MECSTWLEFRIACGVLSDEPVQSAAVTIWQGTDCGGYLLPDVLKDRAHSRSNGTFPKLQGWREETQFPDRGDLSCLCVQ